MLTRLRRARADVTTMNRLLPAAERLARQEGLQRPAAEHLLLAALDLDDRVAAEALAAVGVDRDSLRRAVRDHHADALRAVGVVADEAAIHEALPDVAAPRGVYRSEASAQDLFREAVALAKSDRTALTSGHVLRAALSLEHGTVARALDRLAIDRGRVDGLVRRLPA